MEPFRQNSFSEPTPEENERPFSVRSGTTGTSFDVSPQLVVLGFLLKYCALIGYGITATISGIPPLSRVAGPDFEIIWPILITVIASLCATGVIRSWLTDRIEMERLSTLVLVSLFAGYTVALILDGSAAAWLPATISFFPAIRAVGLKRRAAAYKIARKVTQQGDP